MIPRHKNELTSAFIAVRQMPRGPVIPRANDPAFSNKNASHTPLHAVTSLSRKRCELHEVLIPVGSKSLLISKVKRFERFMELFE